MHSRPSRHCSSAPEISRIPLGPKSIKEVAGERSPELMHYPGSAEDAFLKSMTSSLAARAGRDAGLGWVSEVS